MAKNSKKDSLAIPIATPTVEPETDLVIDPLVDLDVMFEALKCLTPQQLKNLLTHSKDVSEQDKEFKIVVYGQLFTALLSLLKRLGVYCQEETEPAADDEADLFSLALIAPQVLPEIFDKPEIPDELTVWEILMILIDSGALKNPELTFVDFVSYARRSRAQEKGMTIRELLEWAKNDPAIKRELRKREPGTEPFSDILRFTGDNILRATIAALSCANEWTGGEDYYKGFEKEYSNLKISVSLPYGERSSSLWEFLCKGGAATVKAHYALWARYYEQVPDGLDMQDVVVNVDDFCRDLGYTKHVNGGYKPEAKRRAMELLEALTTTELTATYQVPGTRKGHTKQRRLRGTIWRRGLEAEERDTYEDLFGQARTGDPGQWIPHSFSYSPGPWHADKEWRRNNRYVGKIGAGLMQLDVRHDQWAILIGGYLGTLSRTGQYQNRRLRISTILRNTGLDKSIGHRKSQFREKFYRALDRLVENGVIKSYQTDGFDDRDVDMENPDALADYGSADPFPPGDWRNQIVEIEYDFEDDRKRFEKRKAVTLKKKKPEKQRNSTPTPAV